MYKKWSIVYIKWRNVYKKWSIVYRMWKSIVEKIIVYRIIDVYTIQWYNRVEEMR